MTTLAIIRHGPTDWNAAKKMQGMSDIPLSASGKAQVARWRLPGEFAQWRWMVSPLTRARQTATMLGAPADALIEPRLREMSFGAWEGFTLEDLRVREGHRFAEMESLGLDLLPPEGESPRMVMARLASLCADVASQGKPTVAVAHKGVIRALLAMATGWPMLGRQPIRLDWQSVHCFALSAEGQPTLERPNISLLGQEAARP